MKKLEGMALFRARESLTQMQSLCSNLLTHGCRSYAKVVKLRDQISQFKIFGSFPVEHLASPYWWFVREARPVSEKEQERVVACGLPRRTVKLVICGLSDTGKQELLAISAWITRQIEMIDARRQAERQDSLQFASKFLRERGFEISEIPLKPLKLGIRGDKESFRVEVFSLLGAELRSWSFARERWRAEIRMNCWYWVVRCCNPNPVPFGPETHYGGCLDFGSVHFDLDSRGLERAFKAALLSFGDEKC
jgi:hypothetical protein